ncbi:protein kinase [Solirubrobacter ginsenosidimutans]|uniref:non-specific serine/threonine protein kinase n=1 Tax=Solirubrobacter ginsenosidimutans TaxID=490573 RepID=A0A9X3MU68_9ACTN|nr:serine/threonine-protein kinase [Solirubrobacter ginsenosidimutans]MDA0159773.1 protein kinase [Solirubrobacter ginsenosidimutans]
MADHPGSETQDDRAPATELVAGRYRLLRRLGQGSSKIVYLAEDQVLPRQVALALVPGTDLASGRFLDEARLMAQLGVHPNVVTIHDIGEADGTPFIVTPYFEGGSLDEHLAAAPDGRLEIAEAVRIAAEVASGLAHAHAAGIVHRDVKPSNVWLTGERRAALGDFGIARSLEHPGDTTEGMLVGTALYVSPEQALGAAVDARSDLYSLGVTLYELVCGERPFTGSSAAEIVERHRHDAPPPPSRLNVRVPAVLERLILGLLSKRAADRPESAEAVRKALLGTMELPPAPAHTTAGFVGRAEELARGRDALAGALAGRGRMVAITGEPGIGKTRIARELAAEAEAAGAAVLSFACPEETGAPAYWPWRQLLRSLPTIVRRTPPLPPEVAALIDGQEAAEQPADPEEARFRTFEAILSVFEAASARRALALVHEDFQWADPLSVRLLCHLARRISSARILLVVTYRDGAIGPGDPLREVADVVADVHHVGLELRGLGEPEIGEFIERTAGVRSPPLAGALARHTGGNPFFVAEIVRMLRSEGRLDDADIGASLPTRVRQVVGRRLDRLSPDVRRTLEAAAVQGAEFELDVLAATAEASRMAIYDALETARATHLVTPASGRPRTWRFAHAIIRDAVAADLPESRQALLHAAVGRALERHPREGRIDDVEALALHFVAAAELGDEEAERAVHYSRLAAEAATRLHAYPQAARHYERALTALGLRESAHARERFDLLLALADAVTSQGDAAAGRRIYIWAAAEARRLDDPDAFAEAAVGHSEWQEYGGSPETVSSLLEETLERLPAGDSALRATVLGHLASRLPAGRQPEREQLIDDGIAMARRLDDRDVLAVLVTRSLFVHWGAERRETRRRRAEESLLLAGSGRPSVAALWTRVVRLLDAFAVGRMVDAHAELAEFELLAERLGRPFYTWFDLVIKGTLDTFSGSLDEAERLADRAFALISRLESDSGQEYAVQRLALARMRGRPQDAPAAQLRDYAERFATLPVWLAMAASLEADLGRADAARRALDAAMGPGPRGLQPDEDWLSRLFLLAEAAAAVGDARHATRLYALLEPYAEVNVITERGWAAWGAAARSLGKLAAVCGEPEQATAWFERALALHRAWGAEPLVAHTILDHARALPHSGPSEALRHEALELSARLGLEARLP